VEIVNAQTGSKEADDPEDKKPICRCLPHDHRLIHRGRQRHDRRRESIPARLARRSAGRLEMAAGKKIERPWSAWGSWPNAPRRRINHVYTPSRREWSTDELGTPVRINLLDLCGRSPTREQCPSIPYNARR